VVKLLHLYKAHVWRRYRNNNVAMVMKRVLWNVMSYSMFIFNDVLYVYHLINDSKQFTSTIVIIKLSWYSLATGIAFLLKICLSRGRIPMLFKDITHYRSTNLTLLKHCIPTGFLSKNEMSHQCKFSNALCWSCFKRVFLNFLRVCAGYQTL
jgi:hypothetical protein